MRASESPFSIPSYDPSEPLKTRVTPDVMIAETLRWRVADESTIHLGQTAVLAATAGLIDPTFDTRRYAANEAIQPQADLKQRLALGGVSLHDYMTLRTKPTSAASLGETAVLGFAEQRT